MAYIEKINSILTPQKNYSYTVVDLFAGCGGLSLGFEANGFSTVGFEINEDACATYNLNLAGICFNENLNIHADFPEADVLIGGPPCQPFSVIGNQKGLEDARNGFPICMKAVEQIKPKIFLFENVRGLLYKNKWYLNQFVEGLSSNYDVKFKLLNAKHFDVPQNRERVFIIGCRKGVFTFPKEKEYQVSAGEALGTLAIQVEDDSKFLTKNMNRYIAKYEKASQCTTNRDLHLDKPARTLTCRNLAGATGDMHRIKLPDGRRRRLTHLEAAVLQSFPEWFKFLGNETSIFNQIGNAVPPMMAYNIARSIKGHLNKMYGRNSTVSFSSDLKQAS